MIKLLMLSDLVCYKFGLVFAIYRSKYLEDIMKKIMFLALVFVLLFITGCATFPKPNEVKIPTPIKGNTGKYMCPFTSDGTVAPWAGKKISSLAKIGSEVGKEVGKAAGQEVMKNIPLIGGFLGKKAGETAGREAAIALVGGRKFMKETSDLSFNKIDDLIVYTYALYSKNEYWSQINEVTADIYPKYAKRWEKAIKKSRIEK